MARPESRMAQWERRAVLVAVAFLSMIALAACDDDDAEGAVQGGTAPSVVVAEIAERDIVATERFIGRVEAADTIDLRARVEGFLEARLAVEGDRVTADTTLFKIEPAPYEAALAQAEAAVAEASAARQLAELELGRSRELLERETIPEAQFDTALANLAAAEARLQSAEARRDEAEIRLGYTELKAPFDGRIGRIEYSQGDVVGPGSGAIANVTKMSPIFVTFGLSERDLVEFLDLAGSGKRDVNASEMVRVRAQLPTGRMHDEEGRVVFLDNRIDPTTGTIDLRAEFENAAEILVPGMFVNVEIGEREPVVRNILPQAAIQQDQRGSYVLVVDEESLVEQRYVRLGANVGTDVVVLAGAEAGERVIVEGLQRVRTGQPVETVAAANPPQPASNTASASQPDPTGD